MSEDHGDQQHCLPAHAANRNVTEQTQCSLGTVNTAIAHSISFLNEIFLQEANLQPPASCRKHLSLLC